MKLLAIFFAAWLVSVPSSALARPAHKKALAEYFGPFLAKRLNDCRTCHVPDPTGAAANAFPQSKPHNPFGARLKAVKKELKKLGQPTDIASRLEFVAEEDSDGDGVPNVIEILSGHFPGDPADKPSPAEIDEARKTLAAFLKFRQSYPWRPFETVKRPPIPVVKNAGWIHNPIDAFIAAEHEARGLRPRPEASKETLLRRVYLDLIGLPPTPAELRAFLEDTSSDAYEKVVDRLLASPRYGERWGRHWMDIWRYSDWAGWGEQVRDSQPHIWRWRDWIIESLNQDKGYDQMIVAMLAADEAYPEDANALRATGYLVRNFKLLSREKWLQDTVDHTAQAFLGVTLGCARCHDHMFDPILQKEYYQVRAIFEPYKVRIDQVPGQLNTKLDGLARVYDEDRPCPPTYLLIRGDDRTPDRSQVIPPRVPEALGGMFPEIEPVSLPRSAYLPEKRPLVIENLREDSRKEIGKAQERLKAAKEQVECELATVELRLAYAKQDALELLLRVEKLEDAGKKGTPEWESAAILVSNQQRIVDALQAKRELLILMQTPAPKDAQANAALEKKRSAAKSAVDKVWDALLEPANTHYKPRIVTEYSTSSSGRRLAFAHWIANRDNPLTARVAMNHIWLRHFGQAIVPSVFDFGQNGRRPSHPALLDWLAAEFMDQNWSMKAMHRLLVTSNTYRMASTSESADAAIDRDNTYLWRMAGRRMEAEVVRDCLFYTAGNLDPTMGGPDIDQRKGLAIPRRSVYFRHAAEKRMEFLQIFDGPGVTECYQRNESVVPQQALALVNSELTFKQSRLLARTLVAQVGNDPPAFVRAAFEQVLSRPATAEEIAECSVFLKRQTERSSVGKTILPAAAGNEGVSPGLDPALRAKESLVHVLMNHHDFVTIR